MDPLVPSSFLGVWKMKFYANFIVNSMVILILRLEDARVFTLFVIALIIIYFFLFFFPAPFIWLIKVGWLKMLITVFGGKSNQIDIWSWF